ncbi:MAG: LacI family DNA-binding transcriptional regulator [Eubacteriales bacterium]|nr:LacI family DNA-binding transcriptional regulator [Eubacteriales bacterium]
MGKASMRDVANMAGVSVATVSHVINQTRFVSEETRQRVLQSIRQLDYSPDQMARIFKTGRKYLIGFIAPDIANIFFSRIIEEVESVIGKQGYRLIVSNTKETQERETENIRVLASGIVDGLIIASTMDSYTQLKPLIPDDLPLVFIDRVLPDCPFDTVSISNYRAVYTAVETLINAGHKRIGYITGLSRLSTTKERYAAYQDAMDAYGLPVEEGFVCVGNSMRCGAENHMERLINAGCTALIVSNNIMADDVMFYLSEHDLRKKIAVVGYNDSDYHNYGMRHIHTVCQPAADLGRAAGLQMMERIANPEAQTRQIILHAAFRLAP